MLGAIVAIVVLAATVTAARSVDAQAYGTDGSLSPAASRDLTVSQIEEGERLFRSELGLNDGLGPLFNATACVACHSSPTVGGMGPNGLATVLRVGRLADGRFDPLIGRGGPVARTHSVAELGVTSALVPGIPMGANVTSVRNAPPLYGSGAIDALRDEVILAGAIERGNGVHGRPHLVAGPDGAMHVGRFGWKADAATLRQFVGEAFRNEHGITNPFATTDSVAPATDVSEASSDGSPALDDVRDTSRGGDRVHCHPGWPPRGVVS